LPNQSLDESKISRGQSIKLFRCSYFLEGIDLLQPDLWMPAARFSFAAFLSARQLLGSARAHRLIYLPTVSTSSMASTGLQFQWKPSAHENNTVESKKSPGAGRQLFMFSRPHYPTKFIRLMIRLPPDSWKRSTASIRSMNVVGGSRIER
jgi:hypothetical protein